MGDRLAIDGGSPIRGEMLPYGRHFVDHRDIEAVVEVLQSDWLTTGPKVEEFESRISERVGAAGAVAVSNGTAALHVGMATLNLSPGDEVLVPALTFVASANCVVYQGCTPVFVDVGQSTLLVDPEAIRDALTPKTRAIITVDYAGQPCEYETISLIAQEAGIPIFADGCHALGATYDGIPVGALADLTAFSFHPVKHITTGEGGILTSMSPEYLEEARRLRNHGITTDSSERERAGTWYYEMVRLGYNYRLPDINCALGISQLTSLDDWLARRRAIAKRYEEALQDCPHVDPLELSAKAEHAHHLYVIRLRSDMLRVDRAAIFEALRAEGIGVNVHYIPVHLHPFYRDRFGTKDGQCPRAEEAYRNILSLPIFPGMQDKDVDDVIEAVYKVTSAFAS